MRSHALVDGGDGIGRNSVGGDRRDELVALTQCQGLEPQRDRSELLATGYLARELAVLLDGHSIASRVPRFFTGRLPDLNLGTNDGTSCEPSLQALATDVIAAASDFTHVVNGRFKGGYITRHYGRPADGVHALQLEMAQCAYMDEADPEPFDAARAAPLVRVLERLAIALTEWRPARAP